ncbi:hypothetical protein Fmac_023412 [Flemingia macrophylla]|uniref:Uncharacterized protein n=1 Tax=Flemingia macrophylla TaxID=520843 RepID=A0ABD1LLG5_9FABA
MSFGIASVSLLSSSILSKGFVSDGAVTFFSLVFPHRTKYRPSTMRIAPISLQ